MKDAIDFMRRNPSTIGQMTGTESMSALFRNYTGILGGRWGIYFTLIPLHFILYSHCSPSFSNFETQTRNLDMQELDYNPSKKDLTEAKIHHLLSEELKPYRRVSFKILKNIKLNFKGQNASFQWNVSESFHWKLSLHEKILSINM